MTKGSAPNFVVNWLNNKELQFTLAAETLLQTGRESRNNISNTTLAPDEGDEVDGNTSLDQGTTSDDGGFQIFLFPDYNFDYRLLVFIAICHD